MRDAAHRLQPLEGRIARRRRPLGHGFLDGCSDILNILAPRFCGPRRARGLHVSTSSHRADEIPVLRDQANFCRIASSGSRVVALNPGGPQAATARCPAGRATRTPAGSMTTTDAPRGMRFGAPPSAGHLPFEPTEGRPPLLDRVDRVEDRFVKRVRSAHKPWQCDRAIGPRATSYLRPT